MSKKILLIGGGGHCTSVLDTLLSSGDYTDIGIIDKNENVGKHIMGVPIIGSDNDLIKLYQSGFQNAFVTIGSIGNTDLRVKLYRNLERIGYTLPNIVDRTSIVSKNSEMDKGVFIGKRAILNGNSSVGKGAIINTGALLEHDSIVGEFSHIAPGTVLCGAVQIGNHTHIGANSVVKQQVTVGNYSMIGLGSNVLTNIKSNVVAYGNPCKEVHT